MAHGELKLYGEWLVRALAMRAVFLFGRDGRTSVRRGGYGRAARRVEALLVEEMWC